MSVSLPDFWYKNIAEIKLLSGLGKLLWHLLDFMLSLSNSVHSLLLSHLGAGAIKQPFLTSDAFRAHPN